MSEVPDEPKPAPAPAPPAPGADYPDVRSAADLRCSDVDRERVAEALRQAAGDGRLTLTELEERLEATFKARTYGELQPITRDLPQGPYPVPGGNPAANWQAGRPGAAGVAPVAGAAGAGVQPPLPPSGGPVRPSERITSVLGNEKRQGRWEVPARIDVTSILGEVVLDFTEAVVRTPEVEIQTSIVLGSLTMIVPEGIDVRIDEGTNILGERKMKLREPVTPGAPVYRVRGFVLLGEVTVRPPRDKRRSLLGH
ncbi:DUF1707 SHOCT-like domain-containing protein [Jiangella alba]|uniref:Cell wall-active antibiotics response 4TMS YvqF n=1 Tax=Jiangella alba TaxID=561176 RepID=A0A1H5PUL3_9ACTN|nr:DUF1707 domain-containing protein [Jiangella alba]SEF17550.1 Cell wall-active antibiotics response 4TMS YvqF [Jiangella alba]